MLNKALFMLMRGIVLSIRYLKVNFLSAVALVALFTVLHIMFALGSSAVWFAQNASNFDKIRVYYTADADLTQFEAELSAISGVESVRRFSASETKNFIAENAPAISGINSLPDGFFPEFFEATVRSEFKNIEALEALSSEIYGISGVDSVSYGKAWAERMAEGRAALWKILWICAIFFLFAALVIIYQTINISMYRYRSEIRVYSVMGGTAAFITLPFVVVAALMGVVCSLLSCGLYALTRIFCLAPLGEALGLSFGLGSEYFLLFGAGALLASTLAGFISSAVFLKNAYYLNND
jgi:cell division transport system permease protein